MQKKLKYLSSSYANIQLHKKYDKTNDPTLLNNKIRKLEDYNKEILKTNSDKDHTYKQLMEKHDTAT